MTLSVVIAPDSFKGSLSATDAARAIAAGWAELRPRDRVTVLPQADGGEGTLDAFAAAVPNSTLREVGPVTGPDGREVAGAWLELPGGVAVVELAQCSGLPLMGSPVDSVAGSVAGSLGALGASTRGLGEVIRHAVGSEVRSLIIGLGGSASTDGGSGALSALGLELLDAKGTKLADGGGALAGLASIRRGELLRPPPGGVTLLTDVTAPLLGASGAAAVFGPQKGASADDIRRLDAGLARFSALLGGDPDLPGAGAAGGCGFGFAAAWGARLVPGARHIAELSGLNAAIRTADVVLTGEGHFDATSLRGKVVGEVMRTATGHHARVGIIAGQVESANESGALDPWACSLSLLAGSATASLADPPRYLRLAGRAAAAHFAGLDSHDPAE